VGGADGPFGGRLAFGSGHCGTSVFNAVRCIVTRSRNIASQSPQETV
jgi:hypothetical protein